MSGSTEDSSSPLPQAAARAAASEGTARVEALAREHLRFIWRTLRRQGLSAEAADDGAQQVFLVAHARIADIQPGREKSFLYRTALYVAADARKANARARARVSEGHDPDTLSAGASPEDELRRTEARAVLDRVLERLSDDRRAVFILFELEGATVAEIAELLEIPVGTAASRLNRAREDFQAEVKRLRAMGVMR